MQELSERATLTVPPPRIAPATAHGRTEHTATLLWAYSGTAHLETAAGTRVLRAGQAAWVPAGHTYELRTEADTVVIPVVEPAVATTVSAVTLLNIGADLADWLVWRFAHSLGFLAPAGTESNPLDVVTGVAAQHAGCGAVVPPLPTSKVALQIARSVLRDPRNHDQLTTIAASHAVSVRSVQHSFTSETGMPFGQWRTAVRVAVAAQLLTRGHGVGWAGLQVGFRTAAGFTRAFVGRTGETPSRFARQFCDSRSSPGAARAAVSRVPDPVQLTAADPPALHARLPAASPVPVQAPLAITPHIPRSMSWERVNNFHVLVWMYRGTGQATVGGQHVQLGRGDALWLPAGVRNRVDLDAGAILLPLGSVPGSTGTVPPPLSAHCLPRAAEAFLLHSAVTNYSWIRPQGHDAFRVTRWYLSGLSRETDSDGARQSVAALTVAEATRSHPEAQTDLTAWAAKLALPHGQLSREFLTAFGQSFVRWRRQLRMTLARQYLEEGMTVREASARVGYAHPPAFTRAFTRAHGMSPKRYREEAANPTTELIVR